MKVARTLCILALLLAVAGPAFARGKKKDKGPSIPYYQQIDRTLKPVTLTDDQKTKLDGLKKDYEQKFKDAYAKQDVLTPEQKQAAKDATAKAKADGKKGKDLKAAVADAVKETDDQKAKTKDATTALHALEKEFRGKVFDLLTAEQKQQIDAAKPKKSGKHAAAA
jgi:Spy/CpxP family protein refolding chaperone